MYIKQILWLEMFICSQMLWLHLYFVSVKQLLWSFLLIVLYCHIFPSESAFFVVLSATVCNHWHSWCFHRNSHLQICCMMKPCELPPFPGSQLHATKQKSLDIKNCHLLPMVDIFKTCISHIVWIIKCIGGWICMHAFMNSNKVMKKLAVNLFIFIYIWVNSQKGGC